MGRISDDDIRRVREATDLVALAQERMVLKPRGRLLWGCCPFHNEKTPSFKIDPDLQNWHCFGCSKGGDVFSFLMKSEHMDFPEAVRFLADRAHIEIKDEGRRNIARGKRDRMIQAYELAEEFYHLELMRSREAGPASARSYLHDRGFGELTQKSGSLDMLPAGANLLIFLIKKALPAMSSSTQISRMSISKGA